MNVSRLLLPLGLTLAAGCSPSSDTLGSGGTSGVAGNTAAQGTGNNNGTFANGQGNQASTGSMNTCAATSFEAEAVPLTLFIAFDKSGSMGENNKWNDASTALKAFIQDPSTAGIEVALRFFPLGACNEGECNVSACSTPDVDVGALTAESAPADAQEQALVSTINLVNPSGGTPMSAALEGARNWASDYRVMHQDKKVAIILVTDGIPMGCGSINDVANIAADAFSQDIVTYAVGLQGSQMGDMNQVAQAGGSMQAYFIGNGNAEQDLLLALQDIRGKSIGCELTLPETMGGEEIDPSQVNVVFTPSNGAPQTLGNVADESLCTSAQGWYYDDPANPTKIMLCPAACDLVSGDTTGKLDIQLGCATIPQ